MKKVFWLFLLIVLLIPVLAMGAEPSLNIAELIDQTPAYWDSMYYTEEGKEISVHAPILMPEAASFPVLQVAREEINEETLSVFGEGVNTRTSLLAVVGDIAPELPGLTDGHNAIEVYHNLWEDNPELSMADIYAEGQAVSLAEVVEMLRGKVQFVFGADYDMIVDKVNLYPALRNKTKNGIVTDIARIGEATGKGGYAIDIIPTWKGIPLLGAPCYTQGFSGRKENILPSSFGMDELWIYRDESYFTYYFSDMCWKVKEEIYADIPLCSFDAIQNTVSELIEKGRVQHVYSIYLGYVIWLDPHTDYIENPDKREKRDEANRKPCLMIPTWFVECEYGSESGMDFTGSERKEMHLNLTEVYDYRKHSYGHTYLMINAQTGEYYDPYNQSKERKYADGIVTWEMVQ